MFGLGRRILNMENLNLTPVDLSKPPQFFNMPQYTYWSLKNMSVPEVLSIPNALTLHECNEVIKLGKAFEINASKTEDNSGFSNMRKSMNSWIPPCDITNWLFKKIADHVNEINSKYFEFDIRSMENFQFTEYDETYTGFYGPHLDRFLVESTPGNHRKLSLTLQLSDPDAYEGGELRLFTGGREPVIAPKEKGTLTLFPSNMLHEVTPVTKGYRISLVSWVSGPKFR